MSILKLPFLEEAGCEFLNFIKSSEPIIKFPNRRSIAGTAINEYFHKYIPGNSFIRVKAESVKGRLI